MVQTLAGRNNCRNLNCPPNPSKPMKAALVGSGPLASTPEAAFRENRGVPQPLDRRPAGRQVSQVSVDVLVGAQRCRQRGVTGEPGAGRMRRASVTLFDARRPHARPRRTLLAGLRRCRAGKPLATALTIDGRHSESCMAAANGTDHATRNLGVANQSGMFICWLTAPERGSTRAVPTGPIVPSELSLVNSVSTASF